MGRIFGISDLPVTSFMTPFEPVRFIGPRHDRVRYLRWYNDLKFAQKMPEKRANLFIKMRNGIGRLMNANKK